MRLHVSIMLNNFYCMHGQTNLQNKYLQHKLSNLAKNRMNAVAEYFHENDCGNKKTFVGFYCRFIFIHNLPGDGN